MFSVSSEPVLLSEAGLHGLCVSLNTPVLNIDELPVGPARASIVLFDGGYATLELAIGIRSIETKQVVVYTFQGQITGKKTPAQAMEAATGFAEGMGFLFDEDVVSSGEDGRCRAMEIWLELMDVPQPADDPEEPEPAHELPKLSPAIPLEPPDEELVLEQMIEAGRPGEPDYGDFSDEASGDLSEQEIWLDALPPAPLTDDRPAPVPVTPEAPPSPSIAEPAAVSGASLTKFRQPAPQPAAAAPAAQSLDPSDSGAALGRVSLVRKRVGGEGTGDEPSLLLRLLSRF